MELFCRFLTDIFKVWFVHWEKQFNPFNKPAFIKTILVEISSQWWNHNRCINRASKTQFFAWWEQKFASGTIFLPQVNALTILICHMDSLWSMVTKIFLNSEAHSRDQNEHHILSYLCAKLPFLVLRHTIFVRNGEFSVMYFPTLRKNSANCSYKN